MRVFACPQSVTWVEFEDKGCLQCGAELAYDPETDEIVLAEGRSLCVYRVGIGCNWVSPGYGSPCRSCALTTARPEGDDPLAMSQLTVAEFAKRRLIRQLLHLTLPIDPRRGGTGLAFEMLAPRNGEQVLTGHADGVITINLSESNDPHREGLRIQLGEPYRTMLGHVRHEIGHYYWQVLVDGKAPLDSFRRLFGDERQDYGKALDAHYGDGADEDWALTHISHYATTHPWEDFAESFAHYLHIADALETAAAVGIHVAGPHGVPEPLAGSIHASGATDVAELSMSEVLGRWHGFTLALNSVNRSMGKDDLYPFVITAEIARKLDYVHELVRDAVA
ncbi:zinc-binding metallopeptidase family protein [Planctomonas deserti]|uniref:zinc-binding metallopeptidase family protein n=1 Tax=Planctomonas deserti TaxID=2144185 RepID=UPI000D3B1695|nr:putative zinc-binding metallopeptidase [Planctomonas deserti]